MRAVLHLHVAHQFDIAYAAVVVERVAPGLLVLAGCVDLVREEEGLALAVVPAAAGGKHVVVLPEVYVGVEGGSFEVRAVLQGRGLDEHGIRVHVHVALEGEQAGLGVVGAVLAFDDLAFFVLHRRSLGEHGHTVFGVVVQVAGAEGVVFLVHQLDHASAEFCEVAVHEVIQGLAGQDCSFLHQPYVALRIDYIVSNPPKGCVANQICVVVKEGGVHRLAEGFVVFVCDYLHGLGLDQTHHIALLRRLLPRRSAEQGGQEPRRQQQTDYFLIFSAHPAREKSQSLNIGSMTMCVSEIFLSMNLLMASICFACSTVLYSSL